MSDNDIGEEITTTGLSAIAAFEHNGQFILAIMGDDGELRTHQVTRNKLIQVATVVLCALDGVPSGSIQLLEDLGHDCC